MYKGVVEGGIKLGTTHKNKVGKTKILKQITVPILRKCEIYPTVPVPVCNCLNLPDVQLIERLPYFLHTYCSSGYADPDLAQTKSFGSGFRVQIRHWKIAQQIL